MLCSGVWCLWVISLLWSMPSQVFSQPLFQTILEDVDNVSCPTWFLFNNTTSKCECGSELEGSLVRCSEREGAEILDCYCMTLDRELGIVVGACPFNRAISNTSITYKRDTVYHKVPRNSSRLNEEMCGKVFKRTGRICGQCEDGYTLPAYSYDMKCITCFHSPLRSWITYVITTLLPLTIFFFIVLFFRLSVTSPQMMSYVLVSQILASPPNVRAIFLILNRHPLILVWAKMVLSFYGIWNLDFFRVLLPPVCLNIGHILALDYVVAVYPLFLVMLTSALIHFHGRGCLLLRVFWSPFRKFTTRMQNKVINKASIVDVFASFIVLSCSKILYTSFDLLCPTAVYNVLGEKVGLFLYYDATLGYFGSKHFPYGVLAILMSSIFILIPLLLLLLYPLRCFQRFFGSSQVLRIFTDSFQGTYKDGVVEGRLDCRCFSATYFMAKIFLFLVFAFTLTGYFYLICSYFLIMLALVIIIVKPYKKMFSRNATSDVIAFLLLALWVNSVSCIMFSTTKAPKTIQASVILCGITGVLPLLYSLVLLLKVCWTSRTCREAWSRVVLFFRRKKEGQSCGDGALEDFSTAKDNSVTCSLNRPREVLKYGSFQM